MAREACAAHPPTSREPTPVRGVALVLGGQNPITLEYQIYPPTIDTIVTGLVEDVETVGELVAVALPGHGDPGEAGEEGERAARQLVPDVQDARRLDAERLAELLSRDAVFEKVGDSTKYEREEDDPEKELDNAGEDTRLVDGGVERHGGSVRGSDRSR